MTRSFRGPEEDAYRLARKRRRRGNNLRTTAPECGTVEGFELHLARPRREFPCVPCRIAYRDRDLPPEERADPWQILHPVEFDDSFFTQPPKRVSMFVEYPDA